MSHQVSEKQLEKQDYYNIGKEIIQNVGKAPKMCRMGDIYHMIKNRVDALSKKTGNKNQRSPMLSPATSKKSVNLRQQLKMLKSSDSEDSIQSNQQNEELIEQADKLKEQYFKFEKAPIESTVLTSAREKEFLKKRKMQPKELVGGFIEIPNSS